MLLSGFFVALISICVKLIRHIPTIEILFFNAATCLIVNVVDMRYRNIYVWGQNRSLLLSRGIIGTLGVAFYFFTLQHIPLPSAMTLHYTAPIFATCIGVFILNEPVRSEQWFFFALCFVGVAFINGFSLTDTSWYILSGLTGAFFKGLANSITRKIGHKEHPLVVTCYAYLVTVPLAGVYLLYQFVMPQAQDWVVIGVISSLGYTAQYCTIKAYQLGPLASVSATAYITVVYGLFLSHLLLNETLPPPKLLGVGLVLIGVLCNVIYRYKKDNLDS